MAALAFWYYLDSRGPVRAPGVLVAAAPRELPLAADDRAFDQRGYHIVPRSAIVLEARVLSTQRYFSGREADLSPLDAVLGWGPLSDSAVLANIDFAQDKRAYFWKDYANALPNREIELHSVNMHMIAADGSIERRLKGLRPGHIVRLTGYLVEVQAHDGWKWTNSLTRDHAGAGAGTGALLWVKTLELH
jgi:hypothetical protein